MEERRGRRGSHGGKWEFGGSSVLRFFFMQGPQGPPHFLLSLLPPTLPLTQQSHTQPWPVLSTTLPPGYSVTMYPISPGQQPRTWGPDPT